MKKKDIIVLAILAWLLWKRDIPSTDVNITITEPGFEGEDIENEVYE